MRMLFVMDPLDTVKPAKDTTYGFMLSAQSRGHEVHHALLSGLTNEAGATEVLAAPVTVRDETDPQGAGVDAADFARRPIEDFAAVWMRKDPPFNLEYIYATYLLEQADPARTLIINRPAGLRACNEKAFIMNFPDVSPRTLITRDEARIRSFLDANDGQAVIKPLDGMGGEGIFRLALDDSNLSGLIQTGTKNGTHYAMVQEFLPRVTEGDKRILLMDGEVIGAINRVPKKGELRGNLAAGGSAAATTITDAERHIVERVVPRLRQEGLWFVGLDVIGERLTEINVTSPTGIREASRFAGRDLAAPVIAWAERHAPTPRRI